MRPALGLLLALGLRGCVAYEFEQEFWLRTDGSGSVNVTGRPELWAAFKVLRRPGDPATPAGDRDGTATREARTLFERSGLRVRRAAVTRREGRPYLLIAADFDNVNNLSGTPAFPDLAIALRREGERLRLEGAWSRPAGGPQVAAGGDGLVAVRFHLPSRIYDHRNAMAGVERGNIVGWREEVREALAGSRLAFGAAMDRRSILSSTVSLFAGAIALALLLLGGGLYMVLRRGRRVAASGRAPHVGRGA